MKARGTQLESPPHMWNTDYSCLHKTYESPGLKPPRRHDEGAQGKLCMKTIHFSMDLLDVENQEMETEPLTLHYYVMHYV